MYKYIYTVASYYTAVYKNRTVALYYTAVYENRCFNL